MLDKLINETWNTQIKEEPDSDGKLSFRGFYGDYKVTVKTDDGRIFSYPIHLRKDEENKWVFKLE